MILAERFKVGVRLSVVLVFRNSFYCMVEDKLCLLRVVIIVSEKVEFDSCRV